MKVLALLAIFLPNLCFSYEDITFKQVKDEFYKKFPEKFDYFYHIMSEANLNYENCFKDGFLTPDKKLKPDHYENTRQCWPEYLKSSFIEICQEEQESLPLMIDLFSEKDLPPDSEYYFLKAMIKAQMTYFIDSQESLTNYLKAYMTDEEFDEHFNRLKSSIQEGRYAVAQEQEIETWEELFNHWVEIFSKENPCSYQSISTVTEYK